MKKLNPYVEIIARALYGRQVEPIEFPAEDMELAKAAIEFMNGRTYVARFQRDGLSILIRYEEAL